MSGYFAQDASVAMIRVVSQWIQIFTEYMHAYFINQFYTLDEQT